MDENQKPKEEKTVDDLTERASKELIKIKTVFPFKMFPTEVIVDELKVTIIEHGMFAKQYFPVLIKDIKTVTVWHDLFFGTLTFEIAGFEKNPGVIKYLKKDEALKAHQIIVGLTSVHKEKADKSLADMNEKEETDKLITIGGTSTEPSKRDVDVKHENQKDNEPKDEEKKEKEITEPSGIIHLQ